MKKEKSYHINNRKSYLKSIGTMLGCINFLIKNTCKKEISWSIDGFVGDLNGAVRFKGLFTNGDYAIIEQTIVCTHVWNSIRFYNASGEIEKSYLPDWKHGKNFWLLITLARKQVLDKQFTDNCRKCKM